MNIKKEYKGLNDATFCHLMRCKNLKMDRDSALTVKGRLREGLPPLSYTNREKKTMIRIAEYQYQHSLDLLNILWIARRRLQKVIRNG